MLEKLDHPERRLKMIHIAGTNGKGSTLNFLRNILQEAGQEVGTFTSPYIESFNERIAVNGVPIAEEDFLQLANKVRPLVEECAATELGSPSEFEVITVIVLLYFGTVAYPDLVIMEAGLGGRLDSTNVIHPIVSIITNVSYDHTAILGDTLSEIAFEKAGIIKAGVPVITGAGGEALEVIKNKAVEKNAPCYKLGKDFSYSNYFIKREGQKFSFRSVFSTKEDLIVTMKGEHQIKNASLALMTLDYLYFFYGLVVELEHIKAGLKKASVYGRIEQISDHPLVVLDGAHNPAGMESLANTLKTQYKGTNIHIVFAALNDKDVNTMLESLYPIAKTITLTTYSHERALGAEELFKKVNFSNKRMVESPIEAVERVVKEVGNDQLVVVTGSLYFISEIREEIKKLVK
ncbi:bifunctional folylpolyglutamate synthase/dihydrofolate synthase [Bacillus taeanensis]|uniref:tetrahydrofolate synthase n=2 Tax=Bacillus taeanensis TaxID=273032 RepID=A0A366Y605_9BACI|nr:bifunctional folylpolyglutamate synthase/dihydrofolate synthase [Bacillus taeanensis]